MLMFLTKVSTDLEYSCGNMDDFVFSGMFPYIVSTIVTIIKIAVPIILVVIGMIDLMKAVIASKEDEIKKAQTTFVKRIVVAVLTFFIVSIVQIVIRFVAGSKEDDVMGCFNCFINGELTNEKTASCSKK